ncbi:RHS repeat-associated core domain-containing protein [Massilia sp. TWP1-3-3]|uniref:RHS repeat-associated core domain-containing protein n=1 Tax=Massilia sp. TWP1-3-3 TaxID=2804573 RepID=UPI003CF19220
MKCNATYFAVLMASLIFTAQAQAQPAAPATAAPAKVRQVSARTTEQDDVLDRIARGRDAVPAINAYRRAHGIGESASVERAAEIGQLREAEASLLAALLPLQDKRAASRADAARALDAYQTWKGALRIHAGHQAHVEAKLAGSEAGKAYLGKHQDMLRQRHARDQQIIDMLEPALAPPDSAPNVQVAAPASAAIKGAAALLAPPRKAAVHEPILNALSLPVGGLNLPARAPRFTPVVVPSYASNTETASAASDGAASPEAPLSDEIVKQASALQGDYVRIYEFVRNTHRTEWYAGSVKGAVGTLRSGGGNDTDQASLLVALLRASSVPSRYVHGVVELGLDKVANDMGLKDPAQVPAALAKAGVAFQSITRGGRIAAVQLEHVWVAALVPYTNYRGATVDASGKTWIPLDPSFKDSNWSAPAITLDDLGGASALESEYLSQVRAETLGQFVERRAIEVLQKRGSASSYADALGKQSVTALNLSLLPNSLPYPVIAVTAESATLAPSDIVTAHLTLTSGSANVLDLTVPLHEAGNDRMTLSFQPATLADHRLALLFGGLNAVPLYLIELRAQINVAGKVRLAGSAAVTPGNPLALDIVLSGPFGTQRVSQSVMAGAYHAIHLGGAGATRPAESAPSDGEKLGAKLLDGVALSYSRAWSEGETQLAALSGVQLVRPVPPVAIVTNLMETEYVGDTPYTLVWKGVTLDAASHPVEAIGANARRFLALSGLHGSSLESQTFEKQFQVDAVSADKGLAIAKGQAIALRSLTAGDVDAIEASDHAPAVKEHIRNLARLGYRVDVPASRLTHVGWNGSVWRATDPASGASGYFISGGLAGGATATPAQAWTLDFLAAALASPDTDAYNGNPMSGNQVYKVGVGDSQTGIVGRKLAHPLSVAVVDIDGNPVLGASVTFKFAIGDGKIEGASTFVAQTNAQGIASVTATLGQKTDVNSYYMMIDGSAPNTTRVSLNLIDVSVASEKGTLATSEPFSAVARPDVLSGITRTTADRGAPAAAMWADSLGLLLHDQYDNPLSNIDVVIDIATKQVCQSDRSAEYFLQGVVFDAATGPGGGTVGCGTAAPQIGTCGAKSITLKSGALGNVAAGVVLGNDVMGMNTVTAHAQSFSQTYFYQAGGYCRQAGPGDSAARTDVMVAFEGQVFDATGTNVSAAMAGTEYFQPLKASLWKTEYPYEVRPGPSGDYIYWHPFAKQIRTDGDLQFGVQGGGSIVGTSKTGTGQYSSTFKTGAAPALNVVIAAGEIKVLVPTMVNGALKQMPKMYSGAGPRLDIFGVLPTVKGIGPEGTRILLDTQRRAVSAVKIAFRIEPDTYVAASAEVDLFENGVNVATISGSQRGGEGFAYVSRGQEFNPFKSYQAQLVLNRGVGVQVLSEKIMLPTRQRLIDTFQGGQASLEVDLLNKKACDIPGNVSFRFTQPVRATLVAKRIKSGVVDDAVGKEIFANKAFEAGAYVDPVKAGELGGGEFALILTAVSAADPGVTDEATSGLHTILTTADQLPVGHVVVNGVLVRDGSMLVQSQAMELPGRGPDLRFQVSHASAGNGRIGVMGANWTHSYDSTLQINGCGDISVSGGDGGGVRFFPEANGVLKAALGYHSTLVANEADKSFDLYTKNGSKHHYKFTSQRARWRLDTVTDTNGNKVTLEYDMEALPFPLVKSVKSADGRALTFTYEKLTMPGSFAVRDQPLLKSVSGPKLQMTFEHDAFGNLTTVKRNGRSERFSYKTDVPEPDLRALIRTSRDPNDRLTTYHYAKQDLPLLTKDGVSLTLGHSYITSIDKPTGTIKYDLDLPEFKTAKVTDQNSNATTYTFNKYGSPLTITDPIGTTIMTWRDDDIGMLSKTDPRGVTTLYGYDSAGNVTSEDVGGLALVRSFLIQSGAPFIKDRLLSQTDRNGNLRSYIVTSRGNTTNENLPEDVTIVHQYADNGDLLNTTDGKGGVTFFGVDGWGNRVKSTDPVGAATTLTRDGRGLVTGVLGPRGNTITFVLDEQGRIKSQLGPEGGTRLFTYDAVGNKLSEVDENGEQQSWTYKAHDLPMTHARPGGAKGFNYDGVGNKVLETDYRGNETTFAYDRGNRLKTRTEPMGKITSFGYDSVGNVESETDANGGITTHKYNALNFRTSTIDAEQGKWVMQRDGNGNLTSSEDPRHNTTTFKYDGLDRLKQKLAPLGALTKFDYDKNGNKILSSDPNRHDTVYDYDGANRLIKISNPDGTAINNAYDLDDNLTKSIDGNLNTTLFSYDKLNRKTETRDGEGNLTRYTYDGVGNLVGEDHPNGNAVKHAYNGIGMRTSSTDSIGSVGSWTYDADGNKLTEADGNGHGTTHHYDALSRVSWSDLPVGRDVSYAYDLMGNRTSFVDARHVSTSYLFDKLNRQTTVTDARQGIQVIKYDGVGNKTELQDARKNTTVTLYDALNRPTTVTDPLDQSITYKYDLAGNKTSEVNKRGVASGFAYDTMNRLKSSTKDGVTLVAHDYDGNGNIIGTTDANGNKTSFVFDKRDLRIEEARLLGAITRFGLDTMGDVTTVTDPEARISRNTYDKRRRATAQRNPAGESTSFAYDLAGNRKSTTRPGGDATSVTYDDANRATHIIDPVGTTVYAYDGNGNHTSVLDAKGNSTGFEYDVLNRRKELNYPGGAKETFDYDANGNLTVHTDGNGVTATRTFDVLNRETSKVYAGNADSLRSIATGYDANNNVVSVTQTGATEQVSSYSFDNFDRQQGHTDPFGAKASATYDANGNKKALITQDGKASRYSYDTLNRLIAIVSQSGNVNYSYDRSSLNTRITYGNGVTSTTTYDAAMRVKTVVHAKASTNLSSTQYTYDVNGNRLSETINRTAGAQATSYIYDAADRLRKSSVVEAGKTVVTDYELDAVANRTKETVSTTVAGQTKVASKGYMYGGRNQLTDVTDAVAGNTVLAYDGQGNLISKTQGNDLTTYTYDARDGLIMFARNSTVLGRYGNDHLGLRVEKEAKDPLQPGAPPVRLRTLWDGKDAFQDSSTSGDVMMRYESDGRRSVSMWSQQDGIQALHHDALGSVVATTDNNGAIKSETIFDAFGNVKESTGQSANKFGYTGHQMDKESGLIYFKARYYDPELGRFITEDPFEGNWQTPLSLHHYLYAYGNPAVYVDSDGHSATAVGGIAGFFWGFGQMAGGMINDVKDGEVHSFSEHMGVWGQNIVGGLEIGASIDVGRAVPGTGGVAVAGALGGAGFNALTVGGKGSTGSEFASDQATGAAFGATGGVFLSKAVAPSARWLSSKVPESIKNKIATAAGAAARKASEIVEGKIGKYSPEVEDNIFGGLKPRATTGPIINLAPPTPLVEPPPTSSRLVLEGNRSPSVETAELPGGANTATTPKGATSRSQVIAKVNSGRSPYSELNGAIGEFQGYDKATNGLGHVGIQAPGKTSVPGRADYVTLDTAGDGTIHVWDAKYRAPNNSSYPKSIPAEKLDKWMPQVENSVRNMPPGPAKDMAIDALNNGRVVGKVFKWPQ